MRQELNVRMIVYYVSWSDFIELSSSGRLTFRGTQFHLHLIHARPGLYGEKTIPVVTSRGSYLAPYDVYVFFFIFCSLLEYPIVIDVPAQCSHCRIVDLGVWSRALLYIRVDTTHARLITLEMFITRRNICNNPIIYLTEGFSIFKLHVDHTEASLICVFSSIALYSLACPPLTIGTPAAVISMVTKVCILSVMSSIPAKSDRSIYCVVSLDDPQLVAALRGYHQELLTSNKIISERMAVEHEIILR